MNVEESEVISFKQFFVPFTRGKAIFFITIIGLIVYMNSLFNGFVIDDLGQIVSNEAIHSLSSITNIFFNAGNAQMLSNYYRPIPFTIYSILYNLFQGNAFPFHFIQLLFHISNAVLIFLIFKKYVSVKIAFISSILFLIHPINQETVVYIADLSDILFVFFGLLSLYLIQKNANSKKYLIIAISSLFLSLLSKESAILFFVIILFYVLLFERSKLKIFSVALSSLAFIYLFMRLLSQIPFQKDPLVPIMKLSLLDRMLNVPSIIFYYIKTLFYPKGLVVLHSRIITNINFSNFYLPLLLDLSFFIILFLICFYLFKSIKEKKLIIFFLAWFILGLLLHFQIVPLDTTVSDRYFYFPFIGLLGIFCLFINQIKNLKIIQYKYIKPTHIIVISLSVLALSTRTIIRNTNWINQSTLIAHDISISPNDYSLELLYGVDLLINNQDNDALPHIKKALELYPQSWKAWVALGDIYFKQGKYTESKESFLKAITIRNYLPAYEDAATVYLLSKTDYSETEQFLKKANQIYPNSEKLWYYRILVEYKLGNHDNALEAARNYNLLKQDNDSKAIYMNLIQNTPLKIDI